MRSESWSRCGLCARPGKASKSQQQIARTRASWCDKFSSGPSITTHQRKSVLIHVISGKHFLPRFKLEMTEWPGSASSQRICFSTRMAAIVKEHTSPMHSSPFREISWQRTHRQLAFFLILLFLFSLAGCSGGDSEKQDFV